MNPLFPTLIALLKSLDIPRILECARTAKQVAKLPELLQVEVVPLKTDAVPRVNISILDTA